MTIVLADGTIARSGGKVVKNVAGYDLPKLLTGSFGTLGIITEVTFRLHPLPASTLSLTARSASITQLADLMHRITAAPLSLEAMQLRNEDADFALDIQLASEPDALRNQEQQLRALADDCALTPSDANIWFARERLFAEPDATVLKVSSLPSKLSAIVGAAAILNTQPNTRAHCIAEPTGIATVAFSATPENLATLTNDLRSRLRAHGGSAVLLRRGLLPHSVDSWGDPPPAIELMRAIKKEFDPARILNPGRFVGGI
jgi:glycolate oxidase FAD binding subunit